MRLRVVLVLVAALLVPLPQAASADGHLGGTYLALGDSVAAGTQVPAPFTDRGYTDRLFRDLQADHRFDTFVNLACPGDDTVEMIVAVGGPTSDGSWCYGAGAFLPPGGTVPPLPLPTTSQLDAAVAYLLSNPGEVGLISIAIGANDVLACDLTDPPPVAQACLLAQLGQIGANLPIIVGTLQAVAPGVPIVATNYYNPNLALWLTGPAGQALATESLAFTTVFNGTLAAVYGFFGVPVVDAAETFKTYKTEGGDPPANVRAICLWTRMCERSGNSYVLSANGGEGPDIHPSDKGYAKLAGAHLDVVASMF